MSKKYYIIGGVILLLLIVLVAVLFLSPKKQTTPQGEVTLTWWKTFETSENIQPLIDDYQAAHPNVTINYVKKDVGTYSQDLLNAYASGNAPDILSIHNDWLPGQIDKLAPEPANMMNVRQYNSTFADVASTDFIKNDKIYAVPMNIDLLALYYNKDLLNSSGIVTPPATWKDVVSDVQKITKLNKPSGFLHSGIAFGVADNVNRAVDILTLLMLQNGTQFYTTDQTQATFDQPQSDGANTYNPGSTALEYFTQFANPAKTVYTWNAKSDNSVDSFTQGKVAMMLSYYYMRPQVVDKAPTLNWDVAAVPQISETAVKVNFANYWGEAVNKNSKNAAVAWDFLNFITSNVELTKYYNQHKLVASRKDMLSTQVSDPVVGVYAENALSAKSVYKKDPDGYESVFTQMIDDVSLKGLTPDQAISNAAQQINLQLQK